MMRTTVLPSLFALCLGMALALGPWSAASGQAEPDACFANCHESRVQCGQAARETNRLCRDACGESIRTAIADARQSCELDGVEPADCRESIGSAARAASQACRPDCRDAHRAEKQTCRSEARSCGQTCRGPVDEVCVEQCNADFQPCAEDLRVCRGECRAERRAGFQACRDSATDRQQFRECLRGLHHATRECAVDCHDTFLCREQIHECLDSCRIEDVPEAEEEL